MTSALDYDFGGKDIASQVRQASKSLILARHELQERLGSFLNNASSEDEFYARCAYVDDVITDVAHRKMAAVSDGKIKLAKSLYADWKTAADPGAWPSDRELGGSDENPFKRRPGVSKIDRDNEEDEEDSGGNPYHNLFDASTTGWNPNREEYRTRDFPESDEAEEKTVATASLHIADDDDISDEEFEQQRKQNQSGGNLTLRDRNKQRAELGLHDDAPGGAPRVRVPAAPKKSRPESNWLSHDDYADEREARRKRAKETFPVQPEEEQSDIGKFEGFTGNDVDSIQDHVDKYKQNHPEGHKSIPKLKNARETFPSPTTEAEHKNGDHRVFSEPGCPLCENDDLVSPRHRAEGDPRKAAHKWVTNAHKAGIRTLKVK